MVACLLLIISVNSKLCAQDNTVSKDSSARPAFRNIKDSARFKPVAKYVYRQPTNELMRWPNYPLTAEQVQKNMDDNAEKRKIFPAVLSQVLSSKKKITGTTPPKF